MSSNQVSVLICAEDEDDGQHELETRLLVGSALRSAAQEWADKYQLPLQAVGLEDDGGNELNLDDTPSSLGWKPGADAVRVFAFPKEEAYMERENAQTRENDQTNLPPAKAASSAQHPASNSGGVREAAEAELAAAAAASPQEQRPADSNKGGQVSGSKRTAASTPTGAAEAAPKQAKVGSAAAPKKAAGSAKGAAPAKASEASPEGDEKISFQSSNPKRAGSDSYNRYEKYKKAKTPNEAIRLGALKGDIQHDFKKGFVKRA